MIVLHDPNTLLHETVELLGSKLRPALESPERIKNIVAAVKDSDHELITTLASDSDEQTVIGLAAESHSPKYLEHLRTVHAKWVKHNLIDPSESVLPECFRFSTRATPQGQDPPIPSDPFAQAGYYAFDMSSGISAQSYKSILASANLAVQAIHHASPTSTVAALTRPPGHHCNGTLAGGYCYINNIALSIAAFRKSWNGPSPARIAILDLDFHHGNGTQDITWTDPQILYVSIHGENEFPYYSGFSTETGPSPPHPAHTTSYNFPLPTGSSSSTYLSTLHSALVPIQAFKTDLLLVSLGFDTYHLDPLGNFKIESEDYRTIARTARGATKGVRAAVLLEGGYVVEDLGRNLLSFIKGWEEGEREH